VRDLEPAFTAISGKLERFLHYKIDEKKYFKLGMVLQVGFRKNSTTVVDSDGEEGEEEEEDVEGLTYLTIPFRAGKCIQMHQGVDVEGFIRTWIYETECSVEEFVRHGSGWIIDNVFFCDAEVAECSPLQGSCEFHTINYRRGIGIVPDLGSKDTILDGESCFYLAVGSALAETKSRGEIERYLVDNVHMNISTPVRLHDIEKFEKANMHLDLSINVCLIDEDDNLFPVRVSKNLRAKKKILLVLCHTDEGDNSVMHYCLAEDPPNLLANRRKSAGNHYTKKKYLCFNCLTTVGSQEELERHSKWCLQRDSQNLTWPEKGDTISFQRGKKLFKAGFTFFFDFETLQKEPVKPCKCESEEERKSCSHKTHIETEHVAFAYSLVMVNRDSEIIEHITHVGEDSGEHFIRKIVELEKKYRAKLKDVKPMHLTREEEEAFKLATKCHICELPLKKDRVRDHDHLTGEFLGAAHDICNLHRTECKNIYGFAHNFSGYDSHIIIKELEKFPDLQKKVSAIPLNTQKVKTLKIGSIVLLDSTAFLSDSLERLVNTLVVSKHKFPLMHDTFDAASVGLLKQKGQYPYRYATSIAKLENTKALPPPEEFFNELSLEGISEKDYAHAKKVWDHFKCENMIDYTKLYVDTDVILLAEVVLDLRRSIFDEFHLDICQYLSLPQLTKDVMLKTTGTEIELMHDEEMAQWVRGGIRGGLSMINTRHVDLRKHLEENKEELSALYLDANNLVSIF